MAFVKEFARSGSASVRVQPTQVICRYRTGDASGTRILQLDTHGSEQRELPGKVSQTLQLDEARARQLWELLGREFGFK